MSDEIKNEEQQKLILGSPIQETEKQQLIKARQGQGLFRREVLIIEKRCRVTNVGLKKVLIASHIKPWRDCNNQESLNGNNGLMLSPHIDKLLDRVLISFLDDEGMLITSEKIETLLSKLGIRKSINVCPFNDKQLVYLQYHRSNSFYSK